MGREVKRVPMSFDCPIGSTWGPRVCPYHIERCAACEGYGRDESYRVVEVLVNLILLAGGGSTLGERPHPYFESTPIRGLGPKLHEVSTGLAGRPPFCGWHDACDRWAATRKVLEAAGLDPETWGVCETCGGDGYAPGQEETIRLSEEWEAPEPPEGPGWQLWQTVSEGGPVSPVFATPEELARWLVRNDTSVTRGRSYEQWMAFLTGPGWAPSMMATPETGLVSGVEAMAREELRRGGS